MGTIPVESSLPSERCVNQLCSKEATGFNGCGVRSDSGWFVKLERSMECIGRSDGSSREISEESRLFLSRTSRIMHVCRDLPYGIIVRLRPIVHPSRGEFSK